MAFERIYVKAAEGKKVPFERGGGYFNYTGQEVLKDFYVIRRLNEGALIETPREPPAPATEAPQTMAEAAPPAPTSEESPPASVSEPLQSQRRRGGVRGPARSASAY